MPNASLIVIVEPDHGRRKILSLLVRAALPVEVQEFSGFAAASPLLAMREPCMIVCPWEDGGAGLLSDRIADEGDSPPETHLILLTPDVTPGKIAVARRAGRTELIPSDPLNLNALRNRIVMCLEGPDALAARLSHGDAALNEALATLPGLRARLAA